MTPWWGKWGLFNAEDILSKCEIQLVSFEYKYVNLVAAVIVWFSLQQLNAEYSKQASIWKFTGRARGGWSPDHEQRADKILQYTQTDII